MFFNKFITRSKSSLFKILKEEDASWKIKITHTHTLYILQSRVVWEESWMRWDERVSEWGMLADVEVIFMTVVTNYNLQCTMYTYPVLCTLCPGIHSICTYSNSLYIDIKVELLFVWKIPAFSIFNSYINIMWISFLFSPQSNSHSKEK